MFSHLPSQMTSGPWNRYKMVEIYLNFKFFWEFVKFWYCSWSFEAKTGFWVHMQAMNEIGTCPFAVFHSLAMPKFPLKDFVISWKMGRTWFLPFLKYESLSEPQKLIFFAEICVASQTYAKQLSHKISAGLGTYKRCSGPKMALKWIFGQIWSFLAFFGMLWALPPKISVAQSILRVEFEFGQF